MTTTRPGRRLKAVLGRGLIAAAVALTGLVSTTVPAQAATYRYDGQNPDTTGCSSSAFTRAVTFLRVGNVVQGKIELRFSRACQTAWGRILLSDNDFKPLTEASVWRRSDHKRYDCQNIRYVSSLGLWSCYTAMVYDGGNLKADAYAYLTTRDGYTTSAYAREP